ncbi:MAG: ATP-binding cassette domain-containing protein, partial [Microthrixaceae bacterium]
MSDLVLPEPLLELRGVRAAYGTIEVLHGVDLQVPAGSVVALLGPNGAGKSTTLQVACGLLTPTSGSVLLAGREVTGVRSEELARRGVTTNPEGKGIFPNLSVRENLLMATYAGASMKHVEAVAYERFPRLK